MNYYQCTDEEMQHVLKTIHTKGYVNWGMLKGILKSSQKASAALEYLQQKNFIKTDETNAQYSINFDLVKQYAKKLDKNTEPVGSNNIRSYKMQTIKEAGLKNLLNQPEFSDVDFDVSTILTSDLTAQEIEDSLSVIKSCLIPIAEFLNKYDNLSEELDKKEKNVKRIEQEKDTESAAGTGPLIMCLVGVFFFLFLLFTKELNKQIAIPLIIIWGSIFGSWWLLAKTAAPKQIELLNKSKQKTLQEINSLKQQIDKLSLINYIRNSKYGVSKLSGLLFAQHLIKLEPILKKMLVIANDKDSTASNRLLAMENLLYLMQKQKMDKEMLEDNRRANEERVQAIRDVENAVRVQTNMQYWQGQGNKLYTDIAASENIHRSYSQDK